MDKLVLLIVITSLTSAMEEAKTDNIDTMEADTIARYPGYFLTVEEAKIMEYHLKGNQMEPMKLNDGILIHKKASMVYHACCNSSSKLVNYETLKDVEGNIVILAEFQDRKQYFPTETCNSVPNCRSCKCRCAMSLQLFTALVYNPVFQGNSNDQMVLKFVQAPTFCRCFNNLAFEDEVHLDGDGDSYEILETSHDTEL